MSNTLNQTNSFRLNFYYSAIGIILASTTLFIFNGFIMPNQTDKSAPVNKGIISVLKKKVAW